MARTGLTTRCEHVQSQGFFSIRCARIAEIGSVLCENHGGKENDAPNSLERARRELHAKLDDGTKCPCCDKFAKRYRRKINTEMAMFLIGLLRIWRTEPRWVTYKEAFEAVNWPSKRAGDFAYLAHWGLIEKRAMEEDGSRGSSWQLTPLGIAFVQGVQDVPKYAWLYNDKPEGFSEEKTTIKEALGEKFDFDEMMGETPCPLN